MPSARAIATSGSERRPGLDTLRATATLLVVMLHAAVPYTVAPMPGLTWPVRHTAVSPIVDLLFWGIEGAIMPLFFVLSGYVAAQSLSHRPTDFLSTRWRRLGWPLIAAAVVILPVELYIWLIGWASDGQIPWQKLRSLKLNEYHHDLWGLSHLWYLEYLLVYSLMLWAGQRLFEVAHFSFSPLAPASGKRVRERGRALHGARIRELHSSRMKTGACPEESPWFIVPLSLALSPEAGARGQSQRSATSILAPLAGAMFAAMWVLWLAPEVMVGFQHGFLPFPMKFLFSGLFFAIGVREFLRPSSFTPSIRSTALAALCLLMGLMPLIHRQIAAPLMGFDRFALAIGLAIYATLISKACLQSALTSQIAVSPLVSYMAKASFWIYLTHHPLAAIWQIALRTAGWPALVQFTAVTLGTLAVSVASYEWLVRRTWLGDFLNGRRPAAGPTNSVIPLPVEIPVRRAA